MNKYLITLTAPSLGLMDQPLDYIKPYIIESDNLDNLTYYVDEKLMRQFALEFKVNLSSVKVLFAAKIK